MPAELHDRLLADLQSTIQAMALAGTAGVTGDVGSRVYVKPREVQQRMTMTFPAVLLSTQGLSEEELGGTFLADRVAYPIGVYICDTSLSNRELADQVYRRWRRAIAGALRGMVNPPLMANCPEAVRVELRDLAVSDTKIPEKEYVVSSFVSVWDTFEARVTN